MSTMQLKKQFRLLFDIFLIGFIPGYTYAACNWPAVFQDSTWRDSHRGDLVFTVTTMSGWDFTVDSNTVNNWECHTDLLSSQGYVIALATETFNKLGVNYYAYLCMRLTKVTDYSYYYYESFATQANSNNERIYNDPSNTITDVNTICNQNDGASGGEFRVLIKSGSESLAKQNCPEPLLASFNYTHTSTDGSTSTTTCDNNGGAWDGCTDRQIVTLDYTKCSTKVAYTSSGTSWCVASVQVSDTWFVSVYNGEDASVDDSTTYRFACFAVNSAGTEASVAPKSCRKDQTVNAFPQETTVAFTTVTTRDIGATMTMASYITCPFVNTVTTTTSTATATETTTSETNVGLIVGIVIGILFALVLVIVIIILLKKHFAGTSTFRVFRGDFSKSPINKSTASSRTKVNGANTPAGTSTKTDIVTLVVANPSYEESLVEGTFNNKVFEADDPEPRGRDLTPIPLPNPIQEDTTLSRYASPLPQQILTPREPSAYPLTPGATTQIG